MAMYDDHTVPRYAISYRDPIKGWRQAKWKMTLRYAQIQFGEYEGVEWVPIWPSEQFYREQDIPFIHPGQSASRFQGSGK